MRHTPSKKSPKPEKVRASGVVGRRPWRRVGNRWRTRCAWQEGVTSSLNARRNEEAEIGNILPRRGGTQATPKTLNLKPKI